MSDDCDEEPGYRKVIKFCHKCGARMRYTVFTPVGKKPDDPLDNYYFVHPKDTQEEKDCRVQDYVVKVGYGFYPT